MSDVLDRLGALGSHYRDPIEAIAWETADPELPWLPDSVLSLSGTSLGEAMTPAMRVRFSRVEFARLCAAGLWLEGLLIARVAADRFMDGAPTAERQVVLQEVREEAGHGLMFLEMIQRSGLEGVPLLVLAFHHRDEARHIAAARTLLMARIAEMNLFDRLAFGGLLRFLLGRLLRATLYPTAASLAALGLEHPAMAARAARKCPVRRAFALECAAPALELIERCVPGSGRGAKGE
jgi:hypothetical protein